LAALAEQALDRINGERTARGLVPLLPNDLLSRIALQQSRDMARQGLMSHSGLDGSDPAQRAAQEGYRGQGVAEVVGMGFNDAGQVIAAWMGSPDHQKVLLAAGLREAGIGVAESSGGSLFWTVDLGLPE